MRHTKSIPTLAIALTIGAGALAAPAAQAATGGGHVKNPGIVALMDDNGNHLCSGVLVAPQWVLTTDGSLPCTGASKVTGEMAQDAATIDGENFAAPAGSQWHGNDPRLSQAVLYHLDKPIKGLKPARLSNTAPKAGERLDIVAFNGPEGINHTLSIGRSPVTAKGHNHWLSWYGKPKAMTLEGPVDNGALVMRGDKVVGFAEAANPRGFGAEDVSHLRSWITKVTGAK